MAKSGAQVSTDQKLVENSFKINLDPPAVLTLADIRSPTVATTTKFYSLYLQNIGIELDANVINDVPAFQNLQYPDIHKTMVQYAALAKTMQYFLKSVNHHLFFTITDVIHPQMPRHRSFLNELIQCNLFADRVHPHISTTIERIRNRDVELQQLRDKVKDLQNKRTRLLQERGMREEKVKDFDKRMTSLNDQTNKMSSELSEQRQKVNELQQEYEDMQLKHSQLTQSKERNLQMLKMLEGQLVNSPMRFKQDLNNVDAQLKALLQDEVQREALLKRRQDMERQLTDYMNVVGEVKEIAQQVGELQKRNERADKQTTQLMLDKQKQATVNEKLMKEKISASNRHEKLSQKSASIKQANERRLKDMEKSCEELESEKHRLEELLDSTDQAARTFNMEKLELESILAEKAEYEKQAVALLNTMYKVEIDEVKEEAEAIVVQKISELKEDHENRRPNKK